MTDNNKPDVVSHSQDEEDKPLIACWEYHAAYGASEVVAHSLDSDDRPLIFCKSYFEAATDDDVVPHAQREDDPCGSILPPGGMGISGDDEPCGITPPVA